MSGSLRLLPEGAPLEEKDRKLLRMVGVLSTVGLTMVFATVIGLFVGRWLDRKLGTSPWLTVVFLGFGIFAGFRNLFVAARKSQEELDRSDKEDT
jgi:ATP synthase protein I